MNKNHNIGDGQLGGGPLVFFSKDGTSVDIISSLNRFMITNLMTNTDDENVYLNYGLMGSVTEIPPGGLELAFVHVSLNNVNIAEAYEIWGQFMREYHGKTQRADDITTHYLGYWTDGGAYYYYNTERNKTYEQTIFDLKDYFEQEQIPFKYFQVSKNCIKSKNILKHFF